MTTGQLVLIIALVVVAAVLVALILRRGSQRREEQRVEAEGLRSEAQGVAAAMTGQAAFAEQALERAGLARTEAEEKAREAERLEAEAAQQRRAAEETRQEYESMMRRADDLDPDVKESEYPPVREDASPEPPPTGADVHEGPDEDATDSPSPDGAGTDEEAPMTRAERRRAREEAEARESEEASWASGPAAPVAGAAAAAAVGTAAWAHDDATEAERERSARIASAADYRDDTVAGDDDVWASGPTGTGGDMSRQSRDETLAGTDRSDHDRAVTADAAADAESPRGEWGGPPAGADASGAAGSETADDTPTTEEGTTMTDRTEGAETSRTDRDEAIGAEERPHDTDLGSGMTMVGDPEAYAATEPVLADDQTPPVEPERPEHPGTGMLDREVGDADRDTTADAEGEDLPAAGATADEHARPDDAEREGVDAVVLSDTDAYASTEPVLADGSQDESREQLNADESAETGRPGAADWGHDEGDLLDENRDRGDQLAADREALEREAEAGRPAPAGEETGADHPTEEAPRGRRVSEFHEIRDGGFGVGSAARLDDGAQPLDHPVAGYRDTMSFRTPDDPGYDDTDPDVWFYDESAAERSGFHRSQG